MKLLAINAGRAMGNCEVLSKIALQEGEKMGCQVSFLRLRDFRVTPCTGCTACVERELAGKPTACALPEEGDDLKALSELILEADGLIIASPCYNFSIAGRLMDALNREHSFMGQLKARCREKPKFAATIGVAGSDRDNFLMPMLNLAAAEFCGSRLSLVDQMLWEFSPTPAAAAGQEEALERARRLGRRLAQAVLSGRGVYGGEAEELCPVCHGAHLQLRGGRLVCPTCEIAAHVREEDGRPVVTWEGGYPESRWSPEGHLRHIEKVRAGHAAPRKENADELIETLRHYLVPRKPGDR